VVNCIEVVGKNKVFIHGLEAGADRYYATLFKAAVSAVFITAAWTTPSGDHDNLIGATGIGRRTQIARNEKYYRKSRKKSKRWVRGK
jgi:hypothetical protein